MNVVHHRRGPSGIAAVLLVRPALAAARRAGVSRTSIPAGADSIAREFAGIRVESLSSARE